MGRLQGANPASDITLTSSHHIRVVSNVLRESGQRVNSIQTYSLARCAAPGVLRNISVRSSVRCRMCCFLSVSTARNMQRAAAFRTKNKALSFKYVATLNSLHSNNEALTSS